MPLGTGGDTLQTIPGTEFVTDPGAFMARTRKRVYRAGSQPAPGPGASLRFALPQTGVLSKVIVTFRGTITIATAAVVAQDGWPYGLLSGVTVNLNGGNELINCDGEDLHVIRYCRYPAFEDAVDQYPDVVGGGGNIGVATHDLFLTWEVPVSVDDTSLVGAVYMQSAAVNLELVLTQAALADLVGTPANATIAGTFDVHTVTFEVPTQDGRPIVPDLTRYHAILGHRQPFTAVGENRLLLVRSAGQLLRAYISAERNTNARLSARPSAADADTIEAVALEYGANRRPYVFNPAAVLLAVNNQHYGGLPPYGRLVLDNVKENPIRDLVALQGLTELAVVVDVHGAVTVANGAIRVVQETLF